MLKLLIWINKVKCSLYSNKKHVTGDYKAHQPVVFRGQGKVSFGKSVSFGVINAPYYLNSYAYIEARRFDASITFGDNVQINNAFSITSEKKIVIGNNVLIGYNCQILDSNFHDLDSNKRKETDPNPEEVYIEDNVFIGNNVTILKGVTIGKNSVIAMGSVVTQSFESNVVIGGSPAKIIRHL